MSEEAEPNSGSVETQKQGSKMTKEKGKVRYAGAEIRQAVWTLLGLLILFVGVTALILWLVYRPDEPLFTVANAAVYDLNITSPPIISTSMHFTIITRNPNHRVGIYYDRLLVFVSYRNQRITPPIELPPLFHEKHSTVAISANLGGRAVLVSMEVVNGLVMDEEYGVVGLRLVLLGKLRWKAGAIKTKHYSIHVKCDILVGLKNGYVSQVPQLQSPDCIVDI